jgi:hypothetical protein
MKNFESKWRTCAARARQAEPPEQNAPTGFSTRVAALALTSPPLSLEAVWERLALRLLAGAVALLIICTALEAPRIRASSLLDSGVENSLTQVIWSL